MSFIFYYSVFALSVASLHFIEFLVIGTKLGLIFKWIINLNFLNYFGKGVLIILYLLISPISFIIELLIILCTIGTRKKV